MPWGLRFYTSEVGENSHWCKTLTIHINILIIHFNMPILKGTELNANFVSYDLDFSKSYCKVNLEAVHCLDRSLVVFSLMAWVLRFCFVNRILLLFLEQTLGSKPMYFNVFFLLLTWKVSMWHTVDYNNLLSLKTWHLNLPGLTAYSYCLILYDITSLIIDIKSV